ncbi:hypothetical protein KQX54_009678 [Cotesia glomerata]|uniref:Uncharacterized protein n=1 Tax=Cotesia glomerata TaxID=32391 RepID=A0AAV7J412_COTGL|nr:hypothetical protein KQX54_009678 [Cotesia glomerata]
MLHERTDTCYWTVARELPLIVDGTLIRTEGSLESVLTFQPNRTRCSGDADASSLKTHSVSSKAGRHTTVDRLTENFHPRVADGERTSSTTPTIRRATNFKLRGCALSTTGMTLVRQEPRLFSYIPGWQAVNSTCLREEKANTCFGDPAGGSKEP